MKPWNHAYRELIIRYRFRMINLFLLLLLCVVSIYIHLTGKCISYLMKYAAAYTNLIASIHHSCSIFTPQQEEEMINVTGVDLKVKRTCSVSSPSGQSFRNPLCLSNKISPMYFALLAIVNREKITFFCFGSTLQSLPSSFFFCISITRTKRQDALSQIIFRRDP